MTSRLKPNNVFCHLQLRPFSLRTLLSLTCITASLIFVLTIQSLLSFHTYAFNPSSSQFHGIIHAARFTPSSSVENVLPSFLVRDHAAIGNEEEGMERHEFAQGTDRGGVKLTLQPQSEQGSLLLELTNQRAPKNVVGKYSLNITLDGSFGEENVSVVEQTLATEKGGSKNRQRILKDTAGVTLRSIDLPGGKASDGSDQDAMLTVVEERAQETSMVVHAEITKVEDIPERTNHNNGDGTRGRNKTERVDVHIEHKAYQTIEAIEAENLNISRKADAHQKEIIGGVMKEKVGDKKEAMLDDGNEHPQTKLELRPIETDLGLPPPNTTSKGRRSWLKKNWSRAEILHSDDRSAQFASRMSSFLRGERMEQARDEGAAEREQQASSCKTQFFMTWISSLSSFGPREFLSMESVFRTHPSACLVIISRSFDSQNGTRILLPLLQKGFRVMAITPDLPFLFKNTPAQKWFGGLKTGRIDPGAISLSQNLSNLLRLVLLYKYGGVYIDSDIILLKNFSGLSNAIGAQNADKKTGRWNRLNNAVMIFKPKHPLLYRFIREFSRTFNGSKWGHNGPYLVSRVLKKVTKKRLAYSCKILPPLAFYPVNWERIQSFFHAPKEPLQQKWQAAKMQQLQSSFAIHLWNKASRAMEVEPGSIIDLIFQRSCVTCHLQMYRPALRAQI